MNKLSCLLPPPGQWSRVSVLFLIPVFIIVVKCSFHCLHSASVISFLVSVTTAAWLLGHQQHKLHCSGHQRCRQGHYTAALTLQNTAVREWGALKWLVQDGGWYLRYRLLWGSACRGWESLGYEEISKHKVCVLKNVIDPLLLNLSVLDLLHKGSRVFQAQQKKGIQNLKVLLCTIFLLAKIPSLILLEELKKAVCLEIRPMPL